MVGGRPGLAGALYGAAICAGAFPRLPGGSISPNNWVLTCWYSSPGSGLGVFMPGATPYGTAVRPDPSAAQSGMGLLNSRPVTPSNEATSPGW